MSAQDKLQEALDALSEAGHPDMPPELDDGLSMAMTLVAEALAWANEQEA